ncbi:helix-turn-helix domain-containing protein [Escherichia coli]
MKPKSLFTEQLFEWIELNLHKKITLSTLSYKAGCTSRYLHNLFIKHLNISPADYIRRRRLTQAAIMLRDTQRSVTEIALMYGFEHIQTFSRAFKKHFKQSPLQYRHADNWDMNLFYPSWGVADFSCNVNIITIQKRLYIKPIKTLTWNIDYGFTFLAETRKGKIYLSQELQNSCFDLLLDRKENNTFVILGNSRPGKNKDTEMDIHVGYISPSVHKKEKQSIQSGHYVCFTYHGNIQNIIHFHVWAKGHGMHKHNLFLKRGATFSVFKKITPSGTYQVEYYIPCLPDTLNSARPY